MAQKICDRIWFKLTSQLADGTASPQMTKRERLHIGSCRACARQREAYDFAYITLRDLRFNPWEDNQHQAVGSFVRSLLRATLLIRRKEIPFRIFVNEIMLLQARILAIIADYPASTMLLIPNVLLAEVCRLRDSDLKEADSATETQRRWKKLIADLRRKRE